MAQQEIRYIDIDAVQMQRFRANAPAATARRSAGYFTETWLGGIELLAIGVIGLVGLHWLGWSAQGAVAAMLAGVWASALGDLIKYLIAARSVRRMAEQTNADAHVWIIVDALRRGGTRYREDLGGIYNPVLGLLVDFLFGGMATLIIAHTTGLLSSSVWQELLTDSDWRWVLLGLVASQLAAAIFTALRHAWQGARAGPIRFQAGMRGLGLFLLMFLIAMLIDEKVGGNAAAVMTTVNICFVLLSLLVIPNVLMMKSKKRWLDEWLRTRA